MSINHSTLKQILLSILTFVFCSCSNVDKNKKPFTAKSEHPNASTKEITPKKQVDSLIYFTVDDYPVTDEMLKDKNSNSSTYLKQVGEVYSLDKIWFTNDNLKQTLIFELYTDYHRMEIYHFSNIDIPKSIIEKIELSVAENKSNSIFNGATLKQKINSLDGFIKLSERIDEKYFKTTKGIKLGSDKEELLKLYDKPDTTFYDNNFEVYKWVFTGSYNLEGDFASTTIQNLKKKAIAESSFGYIVTAYFKNDKLAAQIIENDIP